MILRESEARESPWSHEGELLPNHYVWAILLRRRQGLETLTALLVRDAGRDTEVSQSREKGSNREAW